MYEIIIQAIIGGTIAGILYGVLGILMTRLKLNTIVFSSAHSALAGAALSLILPLDQIILSTGFVLFTALILGPLSDALLLPLDQISMVLLSIYTALALIFIYLAPGAVTSPEVLAKVFWGSVFAINIQYVILLFGLLVILLLYLSFSWTKLKAILYDRRLAEAEGISTKSYIYSLILLTGITIVFVLKIVGGLLVYAILFNPATAASKLAHNIEKRIVLSALFGVLSVLLGVLLSLCFNLPVGACIALASAIIMLIARTLPR